MVVSWVQLTRILRGSSFFLSAFLCIFWDISSITRPIPNILSPGDETSKLRWVKVGSEVRNEKWYILTSSKPFDDHSLFLFARQRGYSHSQKDIYLTMGSMTAGSKNSFGTFTPLAVAAWIYNPTESRGERNGRITTELTVSSTPLALGDPSIRIGLPPIYFEIFGSRGSNVGFIETAAASSCERSGSEHPFLVYETRPFANSSIRVLSRGQAEVLGYRFSSRLFLVVCSRPMN